MTETIRSMGNYYLIQRDTMPSYAVMYAGWCYFPVRLHPNGAMTLTCMEGNLVPTFNNPAQVWELLEQESAE